MLNALPPSIKTAPNAAIIVDANESWNLDIVKEVAETLKNNGVVMLEQPLPPSDDEQLRGYSAPLPLGGDESCHTAADLERLKGIYDVVNIKLDKTGGLTEAKKLLDQAKEMGFDIMVGCMVGTSLSMAAGMFIASEASYVDLDGPTMLNTDRASRSDHKRRTNERAKSRALRRELIRGREPTKIIKIYNPT